MPTLTEQQAYVAMFSFLEEEYRISKSEDIGILLGSMSLLPDGSPADRAFIEQWKKACSLACENTINATLTYKIW
jgi:hypothetical protein